MSFMYVPNERQPQQVIVLPDSVYHSYLGRYFLGQTETISFGRKSQAWGGLINPPDEALIHVKIAFGWWEE